MVSDNIVIDRENYCINNGDTTQYPDFVCSTTNQALKQNADDIKCEDSGCNSDSCCQDIINKCTGNTDIIYLIVKRTILRWGL